MAEDTGAAALVPRGVAVLFDGDVHIAWATLLSELQKQAE